MEQIENKKQGSIFRGLIGALLGAIIGGVLWGLIGILTQQVFMVAGVGLACWSPMAIRSSRAARGRRRSSSLPCT